MSNFRSNPLVRVLRGLWDGINFFRRLVFNAVFLLLLLIFGVAMFSGGVTLPKHNALVLAPQGMVVEQFSSDPVSRGMARMMGQVQAETQLRDLLRAIKSAASDARIDRIVINPDQMIGIGFAQLQELEQAIAQFKKSGKQVVAYSGGMSQSQYYLAALADELYMHPDGAVLLEGLAQYRAYFREGLQDKLGMDVHLFRVGEYKSAGEPFILDGPSDEAREADLFWMKNVWGHYLDGIARLRKLDAARLQADIDAMALQVQQVGGDLAQLALQQKLVDKLIDQEQFNALMIERGELDNDTHSFRQVALDDYLGFLDRERSRFDLKPKVAVVVAQGEIVPGDVPPGMAGGESTSALLREARLDEQVKAVVLRVDSPGGQVFPSEQIRREVELIRASDKPVLVSMGDVAASGGYWISMNADMIYAQPTTITGSIGIFGLFITSPDTLAKIGVRVDGVGTTRLAGAFNPALPISPDVSQIIQSVIEHGYRQFIDKIAAARGGRPEDIDKVARGRVWSGEQAEARGLVDELGGLDDAIVEAARRANLKEDEYSLHYMEKKLGPFEQLMADMGRNARIARVAATLGLPTLMADAGLVRELDRNLQLLQTPGEGGRPFKAVVHCFCEP